MASTGTMKMELYFRILLYTVFILYRILNYTRLTFTIADILRVIKDIFFLFMHILRSTFVDLCQQIRFLKTKGWVLYGVAAIGYPYLINSDKAFEAFSVNML